MKTLFTWLIALLLSTSAHAEGLKGIVTLAADDQAALAQIKTTPERHVVLYFGDHLN
jgi:predicted small lipoprotein YifL